MGLLWPVIRILAAVTFVVAIMIAMSGNSSTAKEKPYDYSYYKVMSYQELWDFPNSCEKADSQLEILKRLQAHKNFNPDPDLLNSNDQDYNGRLKATIWWYAYRCDKS
jgi:hypothetical protein